MSKFLLALILSISGLTAAGAASSAGAPAPAGPSCAFERLPDHPDSRLNGQGVARYLAWSQTPANKAVLDSTHRALASLFGSAEAEQGRGQLENGLIGLVLDHREQRFVVVLSRHLKIADHQERLDRLVPETGERGAAPLVVQHGCSSSSALARTMDVLEKGRALTGRFSAIVDPASSRVQLSLPGGPSSVPRALDQVLGGLSNVISVADAAPTARKGRRKADRSPHWGAASIHQRNGITCTSWASVRKGRRAMSVTAGHCGDNGTRWTSGRNFYGEARGRRNFPEQDSMRLHGARGHRYVPRIWMDRGRSRVVTGSANPRVGQLVCKSGQTTGVVCSIEVVSTSAVARYHPGGPNRNLIYAERRGVVVGQGGDSGGPVFHAKPGKAGIRGMEVAGSAAWNLFAEKANSITRHLGVRVAKRR